jgi:hypothetical protein
MYTNCTFSAISPLKYGYGFMANAKTFKTRYKAADAERVYQGISPDNRKHISVYNTQKGHVFLAVVAHWEHPIWQDLAFMQADLANSRVQAKANKKIAIAEKKLQEAHQLLGLLPPPPQVITFDDELPF